MKLPNPDRLIIEREKIVDYLLNPMHRYGASKARFFSEFGFRVDAWEMLATALRDHGRHCDAFGQEKPDSGRVMKSKVKSSRRTDGDRAFGRFGNSTAERLRRDLSPRILWRQLYD